MSKKKSKKKQNKKDKSIREIVASEYASLGDVHSVISKWFFVKDFNRIDVLLAVALSNQISGTPVWLFFVGKSGDNKTELAKSLIVLNNFRIVDQLTPNTLASGKRGVKDLGFELQNTSTIIYILDLASLITDKNNKSEIFGQLRTLFDGDIVKDTGSGVKKKYSNCHVTLLANATDIVRREYLLHQQLGTRELLYDTREDDDINEVMVKETHRSKMSQAWENEKSELEMRGEIRNVVKRFFNCHRVNLRHGDDISPTMKKFLMDEALRLSILRASVPIDWQTGEIMDDVVEEVPTRLIKQFKRLYICLKSLDEDYSSNKIKKIISHIVDSTGDQTRLAIMRIFDEFPSTKFTINEICEILKRGRKKVKAEVMSLWNIGFIDAIEASDLGSPYKSSPVYRFFKVIKKNSQMGLDI